MNGVSHKVKQCKTCGADFVITEAAHRYCTSCRPTARSNRRSEYGKQYYAKHKNDPAYHAARRAWYSANREKVIGYSRQHYFANRDGARLRARTRELKAYGLTVEEYTTLVESQHGRCCICQVIPQTDSKTRLESSLHVDHDHITGEVRGLLCRRCNQTLGRMEDKPELLRAAAAYLERWPRNE